jgi:hypothetical protein
VPAAKLVVARNAVWRYPLQRPRGTGDAPAAYNRGRSFCGSFSLAAGSSSRAPDATEQDYVCQAKAAEASMHAGVKRTTTHADLGLRQRFAGQ